MEFLQISYAKLLVSWQKKNRLKTRLEVDRYQLTIIITIPSQFETRECGYFYHHTELTLDFTFLPT